MYFNFYFNNYNKLFINVYFYDPFNDSIGEYKRLYIGFYFINIYLNIFYIWLSFIPSYNSKCND